MSVVYDAGALIAADRSSRSMWARHRVLLESGVQPSVPAAVVAQVSRSPRQAQLRRLLRGCQVVAAGEVDAHVVGALLASSRTGDVVDGFVVVLALERRARIVTSDPDDIHRLLDAAGSALDVLIV